MTRHARWIPIALRLAVALAMPAARASIRSAQEDFRAGRFEAARAEYERLLQGRPGDPRLAYNAGIAAYRAGDPSGAARHFEAAARADDLRLQAEAFYNLGNSRFRQGESAEEPDARRPMWEEAARHFATAVELDPGHADARANLEHVRTLLARKTPPPPGQDPKQEKDPGDSGDSPEQKDGPEQKDPSGKDPSGKEGREGQQSGQGQDGKPRQGEDGKQDGERQSGAGRGKEPERGGEKDGGQGEQGQEPQPGKDPGESGGSGAQQSSDGKGAGKDGKPGADGDPSGERIRPTGTPRGDGSQGEGGAGQGTAAEGAAGGTVRMTLRQAERVLDEQRGEERALIWRPAPASPESRPAGIRRRTW